MNCEAGARASGWAEGTGWQYKIFCLVHSNKVSLILVDYPNRARLKIYAEAEVKDLTENPELVGKLTLEGYNYKAERAMLFHIKAFDWNCLQHITPRFTIEEVEQILDAKQ